MIFRIGFIVAASIAACAFQQFNARSSKSTALSNLPENGEATSEKLQNEDDDEEYLTHAQDELREVVAEEEEEKEEVKLIKGIINPSTSNTSNFEDERYPESESLLSGEIDFPLPKYDTSAKIKAEKEKVYENELANNAIEIERLRDLVKELEEREVKLEGELLQYYGLKEQDSSISELQKQLKIKAVEIDMLKITINCLQAERKKLQEEVSQGVIAKKELEMARKKLQLLQKKIQLEDNQTKAQLLLLKQQVGGLQEKEEESFNKDSEIEKKLRVASELEVEVMELKRKNKELQHEKWELVMKLDAAESKMKSLSNATEGREHLVRDLCSGEAHGYEVVEEFPDSFVRWVTSGEALCH